MSLFSILNSDQNPSSASGISSMIQQQIAALKPSSDTAASESGTSANSVASAISITLQARRAAADAEDSEKSAEALLLELRAALDSKKEAGSATDMHSLSGRGLAIIALNDVDTFSRGEVAQAKAEMRERDRQSALALISGGDLTSETLMTYSKALLAARSTMSEEERALRDANPNLR